MATLYRISISSTLFSFLYFNEIYLCKRMQGHALEYSIHSSTFTNIVNLFLAVCPLLELPLICLTWHYVFRSDQLMTVDFIMLINTMSFSVGKNNFFNPWACFNLLGKLKFAFYSPLVSGATKEQHMRTKLIKNVEINKKNIMENFGILCDNRYYGNARSNYKRY